MSDFLATLERELGDRVVVDPAVLTEHRRDTWVLSDLRDLEGTPGPVPLAVVEPESAEEVATVLRLCREASVAVVPYGAGSGVCGAIQVREGAIVLSTRRMAGMIHLDEQNLLVTFRAGTNGMEAERTVQKSGLTIGHWPQSIEISTVGGWVATRAAGQFSTAYGNIEDILFDFEAVLPDGSILRTRRTPRAAAGPDLRQLLLGSEGTLGVVTEVTFSLREKPEASRGQIFSFGGDAPGDALAAGGEAIRRIMRAGYLPPVVRLYDEAESQRLFPNFCPEGRSLLLLLHEGPEGMVEASLRGVSALCAGAGGEVGDSGAVDHWLQERNHVPTFREFLQKGIVLDTIEVGCTWDRLMPLYRGVTQSLREVEGILLASAHSSHSYRSGTNLYFTFVARPEDPARMADVYRECWSRTMAVVNAVGAGHAHHHGIGRIRRDHLVDEIGETGVALLRSIKSAIDPGGLLNPGALLPDDG